METVEGNKDRKGIVIKTVGKLGDTDMAYHYMVEGPPEKFDPQFFRFGDRKSEANGITEVTLLNIIRHRVQLRKSFTDRERFMRGLDYLAKKLDDNTYHSKERNNDE